MSRNRLIDLHKPVVAATESHVVWCHRGFSSDAEHWRLAERTEDVRYRPLAPVGDDVSDSRVLARELIEKLATSQQSQ
jgi:hypothetical protein